MSGAVSSVMTNTSRERDPDHRSNNSSLVAMAFLRGIELISRKELSETGKTTIGEKDPVWKEKLPDVFGKPDEPAKQESNSSEIQQGEASQQPSTADQVYQPSGGSSSTSEMQQQANRRQASRSADSGAVLLLEQRRKARGGTLLSGGSGNMNLGGGNKLGA